LIFKFTLLGSIDKIFILRGQIFVFFEILVIKRFTQLF